jgi:hypothetical protein
MTEPVSKQAFSKARHKISHTGFIALNERLLQECYQNDTTRLWHGYRIFGIDGSTLRLPDSVNTERYFGRWDRGEGRNENCPIIGRISEIVELTSGIIVDAKISPWQTGERSMAFEHVQNVSERFHASGQHLQLFVFDRGYSSRELMLHILKMGSAFMFRMQRGYSRAIDSLIAAGQDSDQLITLSSDLPQLRLIIRMFPSREVCALLTSVIDQLISGDSLYALYWRRWSGCEEGYKKQKITLELENFCGNSVEAVLQEFWATIVAVNIFQVQCLDEEGPWDIEEPPKERINRSVIFGSLRESVFQVMLGEISASEFRDRFLRIARRSRVKVRPGRSFSRENVGKPKRYHIFRRTC